MSKIVYAYSIVAVATLKGYVEYFNPLGSGVDYDLVRLECRNANARTFNIVKRTSQFDVVFTGVVQYADLGDVGAPPMFISNGSTGAAIDTTGVVYSLQADGTQSRQRKIPIRLVEGTGILVIATSNAGSVEMSSEWLEHKNSDVLNVGHLTVLGVK